MPLLKIISSTRVTATKKRGGRFVSPPGQEIFQEPGSYSFVVPPGVETISVVTVGAGAGGVNGNVPCAIWRYGGAGGGLAYCNDISVTPGETLDVCVGQGGRGGLGTPSNCNCLINVQACSGGDSYVSRSGTMLVGAAGATALRCTGESDSYGYAICGTGYCGGWTDPGAYQGGGGAAGYCGNGGCACQINCSAQKNAPAGSGGGAAGFYGVNCSDCQQGGGGGGGVGLCGIGSSGVGGPGVAYGGGGGSGGTDGGGNGNCRYSPGGAGGLHGGGGGVGGYCNYGEYGICRCNLPGGTGGNGGVRIIWGSGRSYPTNAASV